jgi:Bacterial tandem repeat domain 1
MKKLIPIILVSFLANLATVQALEVANLTAKEYQKKFDELTKQGYRPVKVWSKTLGVFDYQPGEGPSFGYWATFEKVPNSPPWASFHGLDAAAYQQQFNKWTAQGYMPTDMNVACVNGAVRYCVIYDKIANAPAWVARHNINKAEFDRTNTDLLAKGYKRKIESHCSGSGGSVFAALWQK